MIRFKSFVAHASVWPKSIDTFPILTKSGYSLAFIDIWNCCTDQFNGLIYTEFGFSGEQVNSISFFWYCSSAIQRQTKKTEKNLIYFPRSTNLQLLFVQVSNIALFYIITLRSTITYLKRNLTRDLTKHFGYQDLRRYHQNQLVNHHTPISWLIFTTPIHFPKRSNKV